MAEEKTWIVKLAVPAIELEDLLNPLAEQGYHVFRMDRHDVELNDGTIIAPLIQYDVVLFNPVMVSAKSTELLQKLMMSAMTNNFPGMGMPGMPPTPR